LSKQLTSKDLPKPPHAGDVTPHGCRISNDLFDNESCRASPLTELVQRTDCYLSLRVFHCLQPTVSLEQIRSYKAYNTFCLCQHPSSAMPYLSENANNTHEPASSDGQATPSNQASWQWARTTFGNTTPSNEHSPLLRTPVSDSSDTSGPDSPPTGPPSARHSGATPAVRDKVARTISEEGKEIFHPRPRLLNPSTAQSAVADWETVADWERENAGKTGPGEQLPADGETNYGEATGEAPSGEQDDGNESESLELLPSSHYHLPHSSGAEDAGSNGERYNNTAPTSNHSIRNVPGTHVAHFHPYHASRTSRNAAPSQPSQGGNSTVR